MRPEWSVQGQTDVVLVLASHRYVFSYEDFGRRVSISRESNERANVSNGWTTGAGKLVAVTTAAAVAKGAVVRQ